MFVVLDSKQNRIICVAKPDIPIHTYILKGLNLRLEYESEEIEPDVNRILFIYDFFFKNQL